MALIMAEHLVGRGEAAGLLQILVGELFRQLFYFTVHPGEELLPLGMAVRNPPPPRTDAAERRLVQIAHHCIAWLCLSCRGQCTKHDGMMPRTGRRAACHRTTKPSH